jgi:D-glycero-D-manno-heptose 1,7-bisphosphate phosphatase
MTEKALFLDRDGTINAEKNYVYKIEDFEFRDGIFELTKEYSDRGYYIFVVTNQSGIARGLYSEPDFELLTDWMTGQFEVRGIPITKVYHCPHHPDITGWCACRKPEPGMILTAIREFGLDPEACVLIGDKPWDVNAGLNAGIGTVIRINETGRIDISNGTVYKGRNKAD